jgi:2-polyprenyl-3-methyl-5-hydroxy-6-metoxy-1,4-benzoquinol methylase
MIKKYQGVTEAVNELHDIVLNILSNQKKGKLLDAGAGSGKLSKRIKKLGYDVRACDVDPQNFHLNDIKIDRADLNSKFPYKNKTFDGVIAIELVEHLENPWNFIREAYRILRPGGFLIISSPNMESLRGKYNFLLGRVFPFFSYKLFEKINHITPIFTWNLKRMVENRFKLIETRYKIHRIPKTNIKIGINNILFAEINFFVLQRLS